MADNKDDYKIKVGLDLSGIEADSKKLAEKIKKGLLASKIADADLRRQKESLRLTEKQAAVIDRQQRSSQRYVRQDFTKRPAYGSMSKVNNPAATARTPRILGGSLQLQSDARWRSMDAGRVTNPEFKASRDQISDRLSSIGVRAKSATTSAQIIELRQEYKAASRDLRDLINQQVRFNKEVGKASPLAAKFGSTFKSALLGIASAYALLEGAKAVYRIGSEMDAMRASLLAASGSSKEAADNFEFIKATAKDLGKDIQTMTGGFNRLGVAMKAQGYTAAETKAAFLSVAESATAFSLDSERTGNIILAMSQIVSKGRVSLEELDIDDSLLSNGLVKYYLIRWNSLRDNTERSSKENV